MLSFFAIHIIASQVDNVGMSILQLVLSELIAIPYETSASSCSPFTDKSIVCQTLQTRLIHLSPLCTLYSLDPSKP